MSTLVAICRVLVGRDPESRYIRGIITATKDAMGAPRPWRPALAVIAHDILRHSPSPTTVPVALEGVGGWYKCNAGCASLRKSWTIEG